MKNLQAFFSSILLLFIYSGIFSQAGNIELTHHQRFDTFDISRYILPDIDYKTLNLQFDLSSFNVSKNNINSQEVYKYFFNSRLNISNYHYKNNRKLIFNGNDHLFISGGLNEFEQINFSAFENKKAKIKSNFTEISLSTNRDYKFYKSGKRFFELELNAGTGFNSHYNKTITRTNVSIIDYNIYEIYFSPGFSIGQGRIEDVTDIWHTVRILKDFSRTGVLSKNPTDADIIELAKILSKRRYVRFFDYRVRIKENIKEIDNKIKERELVNNHNSDYYTSLYDMYLYGALFNRFSGSYFSGGLFPFGSLHRHTKMVKGTSYSYGIGLKLKYEYQKPINQFWQFDINAEFRSNFSKYGYKSLYGNDKSSFLKIFPGLNTGIAYYPTSRTRFRSSLNIAYYINKQLGDEDNFYNNRYTIGLKNSLNYYISPRARLDFNFDIYYTNQSASIFFDNNNLVFYPYQFGFLTLRKGLNHITNIKFNYYLY